MQQPLNFSGLQLNRFAVIFKIYQRSHKTLQRCGKADLHERKKKNKCTSLIRNKWPFLIWASVITSKKYMFMNINEQQCSLNCSLNKALLALWYWGVGGEEGNNFVFLFNSVFIHYSNYFLLSKGFLISNQPTVSIHHMVTYHSVQEIFHPRCQMMWEVQFTIVRKGLEKRDHPAAQISKVVPFFHLCISAAVQSLKKNIRKKQVLDVSLLESQQ